MNRRYILDTLYGRIYLPDYVWEVLATPEVQRLREIRLCNINSLCLTGGANINRYEHAIGTCYLAIKCYESWILKRSFSPNEVKAFVVAALLHDVANSAFGHTIEYIEEYSPESSFLEILLKKDGNHFTSHRATYEVAFFGLLGNLNDVLTKNVKLSKADIQLISDGIQGNGLFGPLISNSIDLDNIDNVYRLAFHLGIVADKSVPLKLATRLIIDDGLLKIKDDSVYLLNDWHKIRRHLYEYLLLNADEFSGKAMLTEAVENTKHGSNNPFPFRWFDTDYELLRKLKDFSANNNDIISRLMIGNLYGCLCILETSKVELYSEFTSTASRKEMENEIELLVRSTHPTLKSAMISLHPILDIDKTRRKIDIITETGIPITIGSSSRSLLIGVFFKNKDLDITKFRNSKLKIGKIQKDVVKYFSRQLNDPNINLINLYEEGVVHE
ncbi:hypothetical protein LZD49_28370 [Dyadobacter sp. CY261]|uniref:HD domain-containing protein n=1 Tax=Dyadobacter sp. CY261 TaxID=2907203 RepID=UPI001F468F9F|nr:hypothetical protein [Dyadobacter sp. CY261]MCF0074433.1 hypothetical protein [Dyadobacter sp. CY261]